jgi:hypothetical protein
MSDAARKIAATRVTEAAEDKIQRVLLDLDEEIGPLGFCIGFVEVDTRRWSQIKPEIALSEKPEGSK